MALMLCGCYGLTAFLGAWLLTDNCLAIVQVDTFREELVKHGGLVKIFGYRSVILTKAGIDVIFIQYLNSLNSRTVLC